ncbi:MULTISPECIES: YggT family protein [Pseudomonadota]|jgi:YggT family protein|uniref:YggT family protein n=1 Tax=Pseudomonadota TaxID=1224 RepID=UPI000769ED8C|nr:MULTISPECIES: YggT family protein [Pseudomonadota]MAF61342.1 osmotic-shock protein [Blastomonas sp.]MBA4781142.1 YggT family protein [Blastomonas sp.]|tara:strand:+ start:25568 stop:25867 length:300 start_codon:yes stop_codon:yes gene_type:complete
MIILVEVFNMLLNLAWMIILVQIVLSWLIAFNVISMHNDFVRQLTNALHSLTEPVYRPIRKLMPDFGALDLAPMVVILLILILQRVSDLYLAPIAQQYT